MHDGRMPVSENHGPPRTDIVEVPVPIHVHEPRPFTAFKDERLAADRAKRARRTIYAAGD
jgi:hypothetical protein